jgi:hypothetical protein
MLILGLLLLACTAAFTGLALADNLSGGPDYNVTVLGNHIATMNSLAIFCAGLALALLFSLGALMAVTGLGLRRRRSRKLSAARHAARARERERDDLAARLDSSPDPDYAAADPRAHDLAANRAMSPAATDSAATRAPAQHRRRHTRHLFGH